MEREKSSSGLLRRFICSFIIQPLYNEEVMYSMALAVETTNDGKAANKEIPNRMKKPRYEIIPWGFSRMKLSSLLRACIAK